jgi:hypothetical protein
MTSRAYSWKWNIFEFDEQFVLELIVRFELSVPKGGFKSALQDLAGSS